MRIKLIANPVSGGDARRAAEQTLPDESCHTGFGVVVSNCRYYGDRYVMTPEASMLRNHPEVCLLRQSGLLAMLKFAVSLLLKCPLQQPLDEFFTLTSAKLRGENVSVQVDGDVWGGLPVRFEVVP